MHVCDLSLLFVGDSRQQLWLQPSKGVTTACNVTIGLLLICQQHREGQHKWQQQGSSARSNAWSDEVGLLLSDQGLIRVGSANQGIHSRVCFPCLRAALA